MDESLLQRSARLGIDYLASVRERRVSPTDAALDGLARFEEATPEQGTGADAVLAMLDEVGSPATVATTGGRYFGFVVGGALPVTVAADWLATAWDQNAVLEVLSPVANRLETVCERWLVDLLGLPVGSAVGFVSSASEANFTAFAAARHELLRRADWDVYERGLYGAPPIRVVVSEEAHSCVPRALGFLGMGQQHCVKVPVDGEGRMRIDAFPELDDRTLVIVQAGHVSTGSFDPMAEIATRVRDAGAWLHVEGAYGLWAATSAQYRHLVEGAEHADSWAVDAHKYLNVPFDSGFVVCRDRSVLEAAMDTRAPYIQYSAGRDGSRLTPVLSRRARAVAIWAAIKHLGRSGIAEIVERTCAHAKRLAAGLEAAGFEVLNDVVLNQVLVAAATDEDTLGVARRVQEGGVCWCGTTRRGDRAAIRVSICSWATTTDDIDQTIDAFRAAR